MNNSQLKIVEAQASDAPIILDLIRGLAEYEKLADEVVADEEKIRQSLFGDKPAAEVLLAYWDNECAGFVVFFSTYSTFLAQPGLYLEDLFVKPHLRGKGIGFALLRRLSQIALERKCGRLEWEVLDWNQPSIDFYEKLGAVPLSEWTRYRLTPEACAKIAAHSL